MKYAITVLLLLSPCWVYAKESEPTGSKQTVSEAVDEIGKTPWFDPESETITPIPLRDTQQDSVHRNSRWLPQAKRISSPSNPSGNSSSWFSSGGGGNLIGWAILGVLFVGVAIGILYAVSRISPEAMSSQDRWLGNDRNGIDEQTRKRMQELPIELRRSGFDLRGDAERYMLQGNFDEAIKCLFGHQLLLLDRFEWLRLSRGKTNGRYVSEVKRQSAELSHLLRATVAIFEASYFGRHTPTKEAFTQLWDDNQRLEALVRRSTEVAA